MTEIKDATTSKYWGQFVNLYRQAHGSNDDLDKPFIRNMGDIELQRAIYTMTGLANLKKY